MDTSGGPLYINYPWKGGSSYSPGEYVYKGM